jgi:hypothetical protein
MSPIDESGSANGNDAVAIKCKERIDNCKKQLKKTLPLSD